MKRNAWAQTHTLWDGSHGRCDESGINIKKKIPGQNIDMNAPFSAAENPKKTSCFSIKQNIWHSRTFTPNTTKHQANNHWVEQKQILFHSWCKSNEPFCIIQCAFNYCTEFKENRICVDVQVKSTKWMSVPIVNGSTGSMVSI